MRSGTKGGPKRPGATIHGPAAFEAFWKQIHGAFPDIRITIEDAFGADDKVVARWSAVMTHTGEHLGIPATKKTVRITGITIARIEGGKIVAGWDNWDQLSLMQQVTSAVADG